MLGTLEDLRAVGVDIVTLGQYLRPTAAHLPVARWWAPEELAALRAAGEAMGFAHVEASPLTRSSYHARRRPRQPGHRGQPAQRPTAWRPRPAWRPVGVSAPASAVVEERALRLRRVRARMDELGVDALLLSHGADLPWLTGYRAMPLERLTVLVLPRHGDAVLVVPALEAPAVPDAGGLFALRPWAETEDPVALTAALLGPGRRVGATGAGATFCVSTAPGPTRSWPCRPPSPAPGGGRPRPSRRRFAPVKDESEIAALRAAAQAADRVAAFLQAGEIPLVGRTELQVSEEIGAGLLAAGHRRVNFAIVGSGPNGASPHHDAGHRVIGAGDTVVCDFGGEYACTTTWPTAPTSPAPWSSASPGPRSATATPCSRPRSRLRWRRSSPASPPPTSTPWHAAIIAEAGLGEHFIHRTGHGIGIEEHEDPYLVAGNDTVLAEGHAFSVEPGIYLPGRFGMRLEDIVVVGSDGVEPLNTADHALAVIG